MSRGRFITFRTSDRELTELDRARRQIWNDSGLELNRSEMLRMAMKMAAQSAVDGTPVTLSDLLPQES